MNPYIIAIIKAVLKPFFSFLSCSILFCSSSTIVVVLYCSVLASSSSLLYFPTFGAIIFSIIIVPTIEMIIVAAIITTGIILTIVTCGIYYFYWAYLMGKAINEANIKANRPANDNSALYLILSILGLGIVTYCLAQSEINKFATPAIQDAQQ